MILNQFKLNVKESRQMATVEEKKKVKLNGKILQQTQKAIQLEFISPHNKHLTCTDWIPYSQILEIHQDYVVITEWMAKKLGVN